MTRPTRDDVLLSMAFLMAERSTCTRLKVGAVASIDGRILSTGYNGPARGMQHCTHPPGEVCTRSLHAETNAVVYAARHGVALHGSTFYCTDSPCYNCAGIMINAGVKAFVFNREYRDASGITLLHDAGIKVFQVAVEANTPPSESNPWSANANSRPDEIRLEGLLPRGDGESSAESGFPG